MATETNLLNCIVKNHKSLEQAGDSIITDSILNYAAIEIEAVIDAPTPPDADDENGYWWVNSTDFSISSASNFNAVVPTYDWANTALYSNQPPNSGVNFQVGNNSKGHHYRLTDMLSAPDVFQAQSLWPPFVRGVMFNNKYEGNIFFASPQQQMANKVIVNIHFEQNLIMATANLTLDIDINGLARWQPM